MLQTFAGLTSIFVGDIPITMVYNDNLRELVVASKRIASVECQPKINLDKNDGYTHTAPVTVILLNELFNFLVTCSASSTIAVWDVWRGRIVNLITRAHTRVLHGEVQVVSITAGCFDPKHQFLLTAGDDGTLKVWNFNEGICLRSIVVECGCRVSAVFWTSQRVIAMGDNKTVVEFIDSLDSRYQSNRGKTWSRCHRGKILCASSRDPHVIVTSCSAGDLIFWRFQTGQAYMRFNVDDPTQRLQVVDVEKVYKIESETMPEGKFPSMKTNENKTSPDGIENG